MKQIIILIFSLSFAVSAFAQNLEKTNGLYYKQGMLYSGLHTEYFPSGTVSMKFNVLNGQPHGVTEIFYESGQQKEHREYNQGMKTGTWITWDENGVKIAEAGYADDVKEGPWYVWNSKGVMLYEMHYTAGVKSSVWRQWNDEGTLIMEKEFTP